MVEYGSVKCLVADDDHDGAETLGEFLKILGRKSGSCIAAKRPSTLPLISSPDWLYSTSTCPLSMALKRAED